LTGGYKEGACGELLISGRISNSPRTGVLKGDPTAQTRFWAPDMTVNGPGNRVVHHDQILGLMKQHTGLQYSSFERHREATVVRRDCVVTMGLVIVVPKGNVPDSERPSTGATSISTT
jgi:hypothetical protein